MHQGKPILTLRDMPEGVVGIIYRIENLTTGKYYIGRKTVASKKRKKLTAKEKGTGKKTTKIQMCESPGWKTYCGSNVTLKEEVKNGHKITKEIIQYCFSKAEITLEETKAILCSGALEDTMSYNAWIKATIYKKHLLEK